MTQTLRTRHPLLRESEATGIRQLRAFHNIGRMDIRSGDHSAAKFWIGLARSAVRDIRHVRRTQAEIG